MDIEFTQSLTSKMQNSVEQATMSGLKQRRERKLLFTQHTEIAVIDAPLTNVTMDVRK